jgi:hypothetical protein
LARCPASHRSCMEDWQEKGFFSWIIDRNDLIIQISDNLVDFALKNGAPQLTREAMLNRTLWSFIAGEETAHLYRIILEKVRRQGSGLSYPFRCDSPDCRRFFELQVLPLQAGGVKFLSRILRLEFREPVKLLEPIVGSDQFLRICSWCNKIYCRGQWLEVEQAVKLLDLFAEVNLPRLTHGICESCKELVLKSLTANEKG